MKYKTGWIGVGLAITTTIVLWLLSKDFTFRAQSIGSVMLYSGQLLGVVGFTLFSITLLLNTRWKFLENAFGGLDKVYLAHHILGGLTLVVLLFHPMSLAVQYLEISPKLAATFLIPDNDMTINYGRFALYTLLTLLVLTFYVNLPYHIWKFTHQFLGVAYILAGFHLLYIPSDVALFMPLRIYMLSLFAVGITSYTYRIWLHRYFLPKFHYTVEKVNRKNREITEIVLKPLGKQMDFQPGQFMFIRFPGNTTGTEQHPFSITSEKGEETLRLTIKSLGDFTNHVPEIKVGSKAIVEGPYGKFAEAPLKNSQIWIAGGIGITPFLSLARSLKDNKDITLFYSVKSKEEFVFLDELLTISKRNKNFKVIPWESEKLGHLTAENLKNQVGSLQNQIILLCGPWNMMMSLKSQFVKSGVSRKNIKYEEFKLV